MVKNIVKDVLFLGQKSEPVTKEDMQWKKQKMKLSGWPAQICQHECDHLEGVII